MPKREDVKKVLVIGSGPIVIGQAAEFDYAGAQACRALREEGLEVVLINSNPATIMTDKTMADKIYIEPLTLEVVKRVIELEKPDSLLATLGGQTGLNLGMALSADGFLERHGVKLLGANPETIKKAEDRQAFKDTMTAIGEPCIASKVVETIEDAVEFAASIGYPVVVRPAYTLGGTGGGFVLFVPRGVKVRRLRVELGGAGIHHFKHGSAFHWRLLPAEDFNGFIQKAHMLGFQIQLLRQIFFRQGFFHFSDVLQLGLEPKINLCDIENLPEAPAALEAFVDDENPLVIRFLKLLHQFVVIHFRKFWQGGRVKPQLDGTHGLHERKLKRIADGHDLACGLHLGAQPALGVDKFVKGPFGEF